MQVFSWKHSWRINRKVSKTVRTSKQPRFHSEGGRGGKRRKGWPWKIPRIWLWVREAFQFSGYSRTLNFWPPNVGSVGGWNAATLLLMLCGQFLTQEIWQESKGYFSFWPSGWERVAMWWLTLSSNPSVMLHEVGVKTQNTGKLVSTFLLDHDALPLRL